MRRYRRPTTPKEPEPMQPPVKLEIEGKEFTFPILTRQEAAALPRGYCKRCGHNQGMNGRSNCEVQAAIEYTKAAHAQLLPVIRMEQAA